MESAVLSATPPLKILAVHPGADWSTADVFDGYVSALKTIGHTVGVFNLHVRLGRAHEWLQFNWRRAGRPDPRPHQGDAVYLAGSDVVAAALRGDVDWVLAFTCSYLHPDLLIMLKRAGRRIALVLTESPYEDDVQAKVLPYADVAFTNERTSVEALRRANPNVVYLPASFDPERHHVPSAEEKAAMTLVPKHDVVFVGTGFQERLDLLSAVDWTGIDLGLYGTYELLGSRSKLREYIRGGVVANGYTQALYSQAKIGLNLYRQSMSYARNAPRRATAESMNPRALELAACGVFTLSDRRPEAAEAFGDLVPTFDGPAELEGLVRQWLADDAGRSGIARQLPAKVARATFYRRAEHVAALLWAAQSGAARQVTQGVA